MDILRVRDSEKEPVAEFYIDDDEVVEAVCHHYDVEKDGASFVCKICGDWCGVDVDIEDYTNASGGFAIEHKVPDYDWQGEQDLEVETRADAVKLADELASEYNLIIEKE